MSSDSTSGLDTPVSLQINVPNTVPVRKRMNAMMVMIAERVGRRMGWCENGYGLGLFDIGRGVIVTIGDCECVICGWEWWG